jgi:hypothetical protein
VPGIVPTPTATGGAATQTPTAESTPLLGQTLPETAAAKGRLVEGFPPALAPPEGTEIVSSSVVVTGDVVQATLVTSGDPQTTLQHYRDLLRRDGFSEGHTKGADAAPNGAFTQGRDTVNIMAVDEQTFLLATLHAKGRKKD